MSKLKFRRVKLRFNAFCPTGPGGGVDSSCGKEGSGGDGQTAKLDKAGAIDAVGKHAGRDLARAVSKVGKLKNEDGEHIGWKVSFVSPVRMQKYGVEKFVKKADVTFGGTVTPH